MNSMGSAPRVTFSSLPGHHASIRNGNELRMVECQIGNTEIFQMEYVARERGRPIFVISSCSRIDPQPRYWVHRSDTITVDTGGPNDVGCHFYVEYQGMFLLLRAPDGRYLVVRANGHITLANDATKFAFRLLNRSKLVLKGRSGFVTVQGDGNGAIMSSSRKYHEVFHVHYESGAYTIQDSQGMYWTLGPDGVIVLSDRPSEFFFEFQGKALLAIQAENRQYVKCRGEDCPISADGGDSLTGDTLWEF